MGVHVARHRTTGLYSVAVAGDNAGVRLEGRTREEVLEFADWLEAEVGWGLGLMIREGMGVFEGVPVGEPVPGTVAMEDDEWPGE